MFKQIEVDGVTYYYDGKNFLDEYFIILEGPILKKVAEVYFCGVDYKKLDAEILFLYIKKLKSFGLKHRAKQVIEYALEKYLPIVEKYFEKPNNEDVVSLLLYLLIEKQVSKEIHVVRNGLEITCIPKYCELPEESDGYELGMEYLQEHIVQNPSALELAYQELHMRLLDYLPLSYEEDEVEYLCQDIIRTIFDSLDEHDEWEKLSKRYGW